MREQASAYFARRADATEESERHARSLATYTSIDRLRARKRKRAAVAAVESPNERASSARSIPRAHPAVANAKSDADGMLTEMEKQVVAIRAQHRDMLLLFECGYRMRIFAEDAETASALLGIGVNQFKHFRQASVPVHRTLHHCRTLVDAGYKIGIVKQIDTTAMRALSKTPSRGSKARGTSGVVSLVSSPLLLQRKVVEVYTRATIPLPDLESDRSASAANDDLPSAAAAAAAALASPEVPSRFILCLVEETVHHTTLFTKKLHEVDDEGGSGNKRQVGDVRIGLLAHDIHTGESLFDEFQDDANRKQLRDALERIEPVEIVLPVGKLSVYTEQLLQNYANVAVSVDGDSRSRQIKRIRVERLQNGVFEWDRAKAMFVQFFDKAEQEYQHYASSRPSLPALSICCFGGMRQYLKAFDLEQSLTSIKYSRVQAAAGTTSTQVFGLPSDSLCDLDIFRNSSTGEATGSLFSILNHTRTESGARRLRAWMSAPCTSIAEIQERQNTIRHLIGGCSGSPSPSSSTYQLVFEELIGAVLPRARTLLRCVNQIHTRKISPALLVKGLESFLAVEKCVEDICEMCSIARLEALQLDASSASEAEPALLLRLLQRYPRVGAQATCCLMEIDRDAAIANDTEKSVVERMRLNPGVMEKYEALCRDLLALDAEFEGVLQNCRSVLQDEALEFASLRYGTSKETHHLVVVKREDIHLVPSDWLVVNSTRKLVRFHPRAIRQLHLRGEFLRQMKSQLVQAAWSTFVAHVDAQVYVMVAECVDKLASIDAICSLAAVAKAQPGYSLPCFVPQPSDSHEQVLEIVGGRNAILETTLAKTSYMSNSIVMESESGDGENASKSRGSLLVISGPNMGGKSSLLRMCALIVIMAQIGSYVPADTVRLSIFDGVYTRMHRSSTSFQRGGDGAPHLTGSSELDALSKISRAVTRKSFVLIDELGFGMTARHASALAYGLMAFLVESVGCHVMFATHMTPVIERLKAALQESCQTKQFKFSFGDSSMDSSELSTQHPRRAQAQAQEQHAMLTFHYTVKDGVASESFAIHAARLAGIPGKILDEAAARAAAFVHAEKRNSV